MRAGKYKNDIEDKGLTIHVCVLKHGFSLQKDVPLSIVRDDSKLDGERCASIWRCPGES